MNHIQGIDLHTRSRDESILLYVIEDLELSQLILVLERDRPSCSSALT